MITPNLRQGRRYYVIASLLWSAGIIAVTAPSPQVTCTKSEAEARWHLTRHRRLDVPDCYQIYGSTEAAMITHTSVQALGQARLADMHDQARRDALARTARRARRTRRTRSRAARPGARVLLRMIFAGRPGRVIRDG
jgi:hypothetical protein